MHFLNLKLQQNLIPKDIKFCILFLMNNLQEILLISLKLPRIQKTYINLNAFFKRKEKSSVFHPFVGHRLFGTAFASRRMRLNVKELYQVKFVVQICIVECRIFVSQNGKILHEKCEFFKGRLR